MSWPMLAALALSVAVIATSVWATTSQAEVERLEQQLTELRTNANATVYVLEPTDSAPPATQGQVFLSLTGSGVVIVSNLPPAGDNEEFRLWFLHGDDDTATAGGTLTVNTTDQGFALIPADSVEYSRIAISLEPVGSDSPGGSFLLVTEVQSGRG